VTRESKNTKVKFLNVNVDEEYTPKLEGTVAAGFPSPAADYLEKGLNFKELFIRNESSTFFVQVVGSSMTNSGIHDGDILVIDKSLDPCDDSILICYIDGEFTVKRAKKEDDQFFLIPDNPKFKPILVNVGSDFRIWGVVTFVIHKFR
jgi:DNA polymerase V